MKNMKNPRGHKKILPDIWITHEENIKLFDNLFKLKTQI